MKRQQTSFSVEIKKSRTQGQRQQLPPRRLFDIVLPADEALPQIPRDEAVPEVAALPPAPRILPSVVEPMWSRSEPAEPVPFERSPGQTTRDQMELDLGAEAEDANEAPAEKPMHAEVALPTATATPIEPGATLTHDVQPASGKRAKSHERKTRTKAPATVKPAQAPEVEPTPHAAMIEPSMEVPSQSNERRLTKRLVAAGQLPRSERWKRRLHPASW